MASCNWKGVLALTAALPLISMFINSPCKCQIKSFTVCSSDAVLNFYQPNQQNEQPLPQSPVIGHSHLHIYRHERRGEERKKKQARGRVLFELEQIEVNASRSGPVIYQVSQDPTKEQCSKLRLRALGLETNLWSILHLVWAAQGPLLRERQSHRQSWNYDDIL